jgi:hypothetical protein
MLNYFQLIIFRVSATSPILIVFAFLWNYRFQNFLIPLICITISIVSIICFVISFRYAITNLSQFPIYVTAIKTADNKIIGYIFPYIIPFISIKLPDINIFLFFAVAILIALILPSFNSQMPNPLLFCHGYHFYLIDESTGFKDYLLITKQNNIRNPSQIKHVKRMFEYLLYHERN